MKPDISLATYTGHFNLLTTPHEVPVARAGRNGVDLCALEAKVAMKNPTQSQFRQARDRGCAFLLECQHADGSVGPPQRGVADYYKVPAAFQVCGKTYAASRLCSWIRERGILPNGDFSPRPPQAAGFYYAYFNSWVILGADRLGQYDLAQRGMDFLLGFRDPETGGFYSSSTDRGAETEQDLWVVSGCGQAALATGRMEVARGAGNWMRQLMQLQPDFPRKLYSVFSRTAGLHTVPGPGEDEIRYVLSQDATRDQFFFQPGIAAGFLARLFQATGEEEWLHLAKQYMVFAEGANEYLFHLLRAGKVGWAASVLHTLTGEQKYRDLATRVGDALVELQGKNGAWTLEIEGFDPTIDLTAEMAVWLDEIYQAVGEA